MRGNISSDQICEDRCCRMTTCFNLTRLLILQIVLFSQLRNRERARTESQLIRRVQIICHSTSSHIVTVSLLTTKCEPKEVTLALPIANKKSTITDSVWWQKCTTMESSLVKSDFPPQHYIQSGWSLQRRSCASQALSFRDLCNNLSEHNGVVFYSKSLVISVALRDEVWKSLYSTHQ